MLLLLCRLNRSHCQHKTCLQQTHLFPSLGSIGLPGSIHCSLELPQVHKCTGKAAVIRDARKEHFGSLKQGLIKATVADTLQVGSMGSVDELLQGTKLTSTSIRVDELRIDLPSKNAQQ